MALVFSVARSPPNSSWISLWLFLLKLNFFSEPHQFCTQCALTFFQSSLERELREWIERIYWIDWLLFIAKRKGDKCSCSLFGVIRDLPLWKRCIPCAWVSERSHILVLSNCLHNGPDQCTCAFKAESSEVVSGVGQERVVWAGLKQWNPEHNRQILSEQEPSRKYEENSSGLGGVPPSVTDWGPRTRLRSLVKCRS